MISLGGATKAAADRDESRNAQVRGDVEHPEISRLRIVERPHLRNIAIVIGVEIDRPVAQPVVPPDGDGIALDQLQQALQHGIFQRGSLPHSRWNRPSSRTARAARGSCSRDSSSAGSAGGPWSATKAGSIPACHPRGMAAARPGSGCCAPARPRGSRTGWRCRAWRRADRAPARPGPASEPVIPRLVAAIDPAIALERFAQRAGAACASVRPLPELWVRRPSLRKYSWSLFSAKLCPAT
jgi:hypothetical protein